MLCMLYAELLLFQNTGITEKGLVMATTNETMKVIANGVDKKEEPEIIMGGKVIAVEVPDELAEIFEGIIGSLIEKSESAEAESPENNDSNGGDWDDDEELTEAEELAADIAYWLAHRASDNLMKVAKEEQLSIESMLAIVKCFEKTDSESLVSMLKVIFLSHGMIDVAAELYLLDICKDYLEDVAFFFEDAFFDMDAIDWYSIENLLREKAREQNNQLN